MKKIFLTFLILLLFSCSAYSMTLKGGVEYTVDSARIIAFENTDLTIPKSKFSGLMSDIYYYSNIEAIKAGKLSAGIGFNRKLVPFYNKNNKLSFYGVVTEDQPNEKLYYSPTGKLLKYEINTFSAPEQSAYARLTREASADVYPYKTIAYNTKGQLLNINLVVSDNEAFVFNKEKKLIAHWIGDTCYNENGEIDLTKNKKFF